MRVRVELLTILKEYGRGKIGKDNYIVVPAKTTLGILVDHLEIPWSTSKVFIVNGTHHEIGYELEEGDNVKIYSILGGG